MKGFTLPTSNTTSNGSFSNLITQTSANANTIVQAPLMFVRGGYVYPGYGLYSAGNEGYNLSSVSYGPPNAYFLYSSSKDIDSSRYKDRYYSQPIRCVALGG